MAKTPLTMPIIAATLAAVPATAPAQTRIRILAAENVYGVVAQAVAGSAADVASVLSTPAQDPHDFEPSAATARQVEAADLVIENGLDYDPWMDRLLSASVRPGRDVLRVSDLVGALPGGNPHLWYDPATMIAVGISVGAKLTALDGADAADFEHREKIFMTRMNQVQATVAALRKRFAGQKVTATEPVFGRMATALGLAMQDERFQLAVMNGTEPRAGDVAAIEDDLRHHRVRVLFHNAQVGDAASDRLIGIARGAGIPVVGVAETMPSGTDYPSWILHILTEVRRALEASPAAMTKG